MAQGRQLRKSARFMGSVFHAADVLAGVGDGVGVDAGLPVAEVQPARVDARGSATVRPVARSFNTMAERLEQADRERRQLLAELGHELRTPLTVVRGEIEAMIEREEIEHKKAEQEAAEKKLFEEDTERDR